MKKLLLFVLCVFTLVSAASYAGQLPWYKYYINKDGTRNLYIEEQLVFSYYELFVLKSKTNPEMYIVVKTDSLPRDVEQSEILNYSNVFLTGLDNLDEYLAGTEAHFFYNIEMKLSNRSDNSSIIKKVDSDFLNFDCYEFIQRPLFYYSILIRGSLYRTSLNDSLRQDTTEPVGICNLNSFYQMLLPGWKKE